LSILAFKFNKVSIKGFWILLLAGILSILGHFLLFFGLPYFSFNEVPKIADELVIKTELRLEPPKKIRLSSAPKKKIVTQQSNAIPSDIADNGGQGEDLGDLKQGQAFRLPESGIFYYDAYVDGQLYQTGQLNWLFENNIYHLHIEIPYAFVGPFIFDSRGTVDSYGLAPAIYWTQRGDKPPRYSRFDRDENGGGHMYFSEKPEFTPDIIPGTQDRFSLLFQLASLLNGSDKIDYPGSIRSIPVVDYNTLEMWQFKSYGEVLSEDVPSLGISVNRHYALMQRTSEPFKRQIEFWLSRDLDWLPGKIRSTEANGRNLELIFKQKLLNKSVN
jgi:hypothetical protein